jgi:hypothetical protein
MASEVRSRLAEFSTCCTIFNAGAFEYAAPDGRIEPTLFR